MKSFGNGGGGDVAIAGGEQYRDVRILLFHHLGQFETIHSVGHHDVRENKVEFLPSSQQFERSRVGFPDATTQDNRCTG